MEENRMKTESEIDKNYIVEVEFDGEHVPMAPFVHDIIKNVILGLMKSILGYFPGKEIKIIMKQQEK
jgi:uncharacterized membrane protein